MPEPSFIKTTERGQRESVDESCAISGGDPEASWEERSVYSLKVLFCHPDKLVNASAEEKVNKNTETGNRCPNFSCSSCCYLSEATRMLEPADILVTVNTGKSPFAIMKRWFLGSPYEHIFLYLGTIDFAPLDKPPLRVPMLFESNGRGVCLRLLSERYGEEVVILRLISEHDRRRIPHVLEEAIKLASNLQSYYDYMCIVKYILPRLICEKLGLPMPLKYHRDPWHVCSEAVFEVFYRAKLVDILPVNIVPLPGDFVTDSLLLEEVWRGRLSEKVVSYE